jgi:hypothetical protein
MLVTATGKILPVAVAVLGKDKRGKRLGIQIYIDGGVKRPLY